MMALEDTAGTLGQHICLTISILRLALWPFTSPHLASGTCDDVSSVTPLRALFPAPNDGRHA